MEKYFSEHYIQLPREILIGNRIIEKIGEYCQKLGFKKSALILIGPNINELIGKEIEESLIKYNFKFDKLIVKESEVHYVNITTKIINEFEPDIVLGVGGGKVIDVAKLASFYSKKPFMSIPTAVSHDGIASPRASIKDIGKSTSVQAQSPLGIIADTEIIAKSPYRLTASGCGDIIAKYTSVKDWQLANKLKGEYYGEYAASLALMSSKLIMKNAETIKDQKEVGFRIILEALLSCGVAMNIAGSSRPCSGSEHLFSHALDFIIPNNALHGEKCGVGAIMMAYLQKSNWKLVKNKLKILKAPTTAYELGIDDEKIIDALHIANKLNPERYTILGEGITKELAKKIAKITGIIK